MRIAWFTPFSKKSAIGRVSQLVVAELSKVADVHICHFEGGPVRTAAVPVKRFSSAAQVDEHFGANYDIAIYNFGNHLPFHRDIFLASRRHPGICILHDFVMHHFFAAYYLEELRNPAAYSLMMERHYGPDGAVAARHKVWETADVVRFPLYEEVVHGALAVVTHSEFFRKRVAAVFPGPVRRIALPYDVPAATPPPARASIGIGDDQTVIVSIGHVNPNRQMEAAIQALAQLGPAARRVVYAIIGPCAPDYRRVLAAAVRHANLETSVRFLGHVPDDVLHAWLSHADLCINLRYPSTEGASASVIEQMLAGKPVIVTDTGFFSELPDDCVAKVRPGRQSDLTAHLARLVSGSELRNSMGEAARRYASREFRADTYAREILDFAWDVRRAAPLLGLSDRVALECNRMGVAANMEIVDTIARELHSLFSGAGQSE